MKRLVILVFAALLAAALPVHSADPPESSGQEEAIAKAVAKLGDADFAVREAAMDELVKLGEPARKQLEAAVGATEDAETRRGAKEILLLLDEDRLWSGGVHVVGVYQAGTGQKFQLLNQAGRDIDWRRFSRDVVEQSEVEGLNPGKRLWELLSREARNVLVDKRKIELVSLVCSPEPIEIAREARQEGDEAWRVLCGSLLDVLNGSDFYQETVFKKVKLNEEGEKLRERYKDLSLLEHHILKRWLFEASFPESIQKTNFSLAGATVRVRVLPTDKAITVVLCNYNPVRWVIDVEKHAKIERVIVGGHHYQDVLGIIAPITYRVVARQKPSESSPDFFLAYEVDKTDYPQMVEAVRKLTGREITTFQGRYAYSDGPPFIIGSQKRPKR